MTVMRLQKGKPFRRVRNVARRKARTVRAQRRLTVVTGSTISVSGTVVTLVTEVIAAIAGVELIAKEGQGVVAAASVAQDRAVVGLAHPVDGAVGPATREVAGGEGIGHVVHRHPERLGPLLHLGHQYVLVGFQPRKRSRRCARI